MGEVETANYFWAHALLIMNAAATTAPLGGRPLALRAISKSKSSKMEIRPSFFFLHNDAYRDQAIPILPFSK